MNDVVKLGATFLLISETIKAFPTFSKPITSIRHIQEGTSEATDARIGYGLAIGWSLFVAAAVAQSTKQQHVFSIWAVMAGSMVLFYEYSIRMVDVDG